LNASQEREWCPVDVDLLVLLASGLTLLYIAEKPESLSLIADVGIFCRPDLLLWCVDTQSMSRKEALEKMALADSRLQPICGSFIAASGLWPDTDDSDGSQDLNNQREETASRIRVLTVGFDRLQLIPVIDALGETEGSAITT
jgi:hypothetical protein